MLEQIRNQVMQKINLSEDLSDEELLECTDQVLMEMSKHCYLPLTEKRRYRKAVFDSFRRLDVLSEALDDPEVTEIMVNGPSQIFVEKAGEIRPFGKSFATREKLEDVIQQIVAKVNRRVNEASPLADARLPDGSRVNIVLPPVALDGPVVTIRRFFEEPPAMEDLIHWGSISREAAEVLKLFVCARYNIFICGGTGSGKTTFLGALAEFIPEEERVITIEDSAELRLRQVKNLVRLESRAANQEGQYEVTIRDLIRNSLRMRPDRCIVGEIRSGEALDMLTAMNTGHDGSMSTGHANSAYDMLSRIETMTLMAMELPLPAVRGQIASALDILVYLGRLRDKSRKVLSIEEISGMEDGRILLSPLYEFTEKGEEDGRVLGELEFKAPLIHQEKLKAAGLQHLYQAAIPASASVDSD